jgi:hypothetical protein
MVVTAISGNEDAKGIKSIILIGRVAKEKENDKARKFYLFTDLKNP